MSKLIVRESKLQNVVIVGAGEIAQNFYESTIKNRQFGYNFAGYLDDNEEESNHTEFDR